MIRGKNSCYLHLHKPTAYPDKPEAYLLVQLGVKVSGKSMADGSWRIMPLKCEGTGSGVINCVRKVRVAEGEDLLCLRKGSAPMYFDDIRGLKMLQVIIRLHYMTYLIELS